MNFSRDIYKNNTEPVAPKETVAATNISLMLGYIASMGVSSIIDDLDKMIKQNKRQEVDGYILALSRIMKHSIAFDCIQKAFTKNNEVVPGKYKNIFSATK